MNITELMRYFLSIILAIFPLISWGQDVDPDTIKTQQLSEVVVEAEMQRTSANVSTYIPAKRQKEASQDAVALLSQMAIPQLDVDPAGKSVRTVSGQPVSIFIDYVPATTQDLSGMRTTDVKKVEYLLNPLDVRFKGAQYVINFIMQKYEWGGYTKLYADKWFGVNRTEGSVYSKFSYKKMTYDVYADEVYLTNRHTGVISSETFRLPNLNGNGEQTINRFSTPTSSLYRNNSNNITLRALYASDNTQISNLFQFNNTSIPHDDSQNALTYANDFLPGSVATRLTSNHNLGFYYNLEAYRAISQKLAFNIEAAYQFYHNKSNSDYSEQDTRILNNADEKYHYVKATPCLVWNPNQYNNILPYMRGDEVNGIGSGNSSILK